MRQAKVYLEVVLLLSCFFTACGCQTAPLVSSQAADEELLQRVSALESELLDRDIEITRLNAQLIRQRQTNMNLMKSLCRPQQDTDEAEDKITAPNSGYHYSIMAVQMALRNAGFEIGLVDGKMGKRTTLAIRDFQRSAGLPVSGSIDKHTWELLRRYSYSE